MHGLHTEIRRVNTSGDAFIWIVYLVAYDMGRRIRKFVTACDTEMKAQRVSDSLTGANR